MLFINFLCLFFLMVLINCHTISKSIINNKETNGVFENINNLDDVVDDDGNNGRYHRKGRREDFTYDSSKQFYLSPKSTLAKRMYKGTTNRKNVHLNNLMRTALLTTKKKRKGIWRRLHKKFKFGRNDKDEEGDAVKRRQVLTDVQGSRPSLHLSELDNYMTTTYAQNINFTAKRNEKKNDINIKYGVRYPNKDRETRFRNPNRNLRLANEAEDTFDQIERTPRRGHGNRRHKKSIEVKIIPYRKMSTHRYRLPTLIKTYKPLSKTSDDFMDLLADISPERQKNMEFDNEKLKMNGITPLVASGQSKTNYLPSNTEAVTINPETLDNSEFSGTAQIEALLNDIKVKAIQMIAEQNPSISDIITNAVTETTFAADPIISHINMDKSNHFSTFVSIKDINKRSAEDNDDVEEESNVDKSGDKPKMDDILTTVRSNEIVGDEPSWKRVFEKVKEFVVEDVKEDLKEGKKKIQNFKIATVGYAQKIIKPCLEPSSTIKKKCTTTKKPKPCCDKDCCKVKCCEKCCDVCVKGSEPTHAENRAVVKEAAKQALSPGSFAFRKNRSENETTVTTTPRMARSISDETNYLDKRLQKLKESNTKSTATTLMAALFDDYEMLSLYEKMLKKSREDNVMKMLSAQIAPTNKKIKRENCRLSKRNSETLTDLNLKKDVEKLYEEGEGMPEELDYNVYDMTTTEPTNTNSDYQNEELDSSTNIDGLSKKIYFKDYVNGYKHYLDFQREQGNQFSDSIRYQAHRHHNVDDIGKFILNKLPPTPDIYNRYERDFFDVSDTMEDQDMSTKTDDSWFKKHFYFFIDSGPPKKYHTSQTITLKSPMTDSNVEFSTSKEVMPDAVNDNTIAAANGLNELEELRDEIQDFELNDRTVSPYDSADQDLDPEEELSHNLIKKYANHKYIQDPKEVTILPRNNNRRNARRVPEFDDELKYTASDKELGKKSKNQGYVDVNIVAQPTSIVNLRDANTKSSRIKSFFSKFSLRKKNKTRKIKRDSNRYQRFNPLKGIKEMFYAKNTFTAATTETTDFEMPAHVQGFKPIKYSKTPTIDEMKAEISVMSGDDKNAPVYLESKKVTPSTKLVDVLLPWEYGTNQDSYYIKPNQYTQPTRPIYGSAGTYQQDVQNLNNRKNANDKPRKNEKFKLNKTSAHDVFNINVQTVSERPQKADKQYKETATELYDPHAVEDITKEIQVMEVSLNNNRYKHVKPKLQKIEQPANAKQDDQMMKYGKVEDGVLDESFEGPIVIPTKLDNYTFDILLKKPHPYKQNTVKRIRKETTTEDDDKPEEDSDEQDSPSDDTVDEESFDETSDNIEQRTEAKSMFESYSDKIKEDLKEDLAVILSTAKVEKTGPEKTVDTDEQTSTTVSIKPKTAQLTDEYSNKAKTTVLTKYSDPTKSLETPESTKTDGSLETTKLTNPSSEILPDTPSPDTTLLNKSPDTTISCKLHKTTQNLKLLKKTSTDTTSSKTTKSISSVIEAVTTSKPSDKTLSNDFHTYPDYFSDLVIWNDDILSSDSVPFSLWDDLLSKVQNEPEFTTPDLKNLQKEIYLLRERIVNNSSHSYDDHANITDTTLTTTIKKEDHTTNKATTKLTRATTSLNTLNHWPSKKLNAIRFINDFNRINAKSRELLDRKSCKKMRERKQNVGSRGVKKCVTNSNLTKIENEPIESLLERVRIKKSKGAKNSKQSTSSSKMTKPEQYFATPVPMENSDFEKFLVEHDIDVGSVTSPLFKLPSVNRDPTTTVTSNSEEMLDLLNNIEHTPQPTETTNSDVAVVLKSLSKKQYLINPNIANHLRRSLINFKHQKSKDKISRHYTPEPSKVVDDEFDLTIINLSDMGSDTFNSKDAIMLPAGTFPDELMNPEDENTLFPTSFETSNTTISANNDPYMKETTVTDETIYSSTTMDEDNFPLSTSDDDSILNTDTLAEIKTKLNAAANVKHIADNLTSAKNFPILTWPMTDENVYSGTAAPSLTSNPSTTKSSIKTELTTETLPKDTPTTKPATVSENNESWAPTASLDIEDSTKIAGFDAKKHKSVTVVHEDLKDVPIISYPAEAITTTISANSGMRSPAETTDTTTLAPETTTSSEMIPNTVLTSTKLSKLSKVFEESKERVKAIFTNHHKFKSPFTSPISDAATYRYTNIQKKFHPANIPQVVRFSSHSCIYDLLFDSDKATNSPITKSTTPVTLTKMVSRSMTGSTETSEINAIFEIIEMIEAIENCTRPSVILHIDLPIYYEPNPNVPEPIVMPKKTVWSDHVLKYISGIALLEMLHKFGLTKMLLEGLDKSVNMNETFSAGKEEKGGGLTDDKAKTSTKPAKATEEKKKEEVVRKEREAPTEGIDFLSDVQGSMIFDLMTMAPSKAYQKRGRIGHSNSARPSVTKHHRRHTPRPNLHKMALASLDFVPAKGNTKRRSAVSETTTTIISVTKRPRTRIEQGPRMLAHLPKTTTAQTKPTTTTTETMKAISEVVGPGAPAKAAGHLETDNLDSIDADAAAMEKTTDALTKQLKKTTDKLAMAGRVADVLQPASDTVLAARDRDALGRKLYGPPDNITASRAEAIKMTTVKVLGDLKRILTGHRQVVVSATHKNVTAKPATSTHKREASIYYDEYEEDLENIDPILLKKYAYPTTESNERVKKREIRESNMYTAKDVAALEVIVDLTENAINNEEKETTNNNMDRLFRADDVNTNVIKVHIGVPYNGDAALKRSLVPVKVRKVFSAKLSPPVDIAYQIHTYEETTTAAPRSNISPGKYMFISNESISLPRGNFFLKPISTRLENRFDPNPTASTKNVRSDSAATGRVTLSKDFIAAINCHLMQLYENLTTVPESTVSLKGMEENMTNFTTAKMVRRRRQCIDWSKIKKHFDINGTCCKKKYKPNVPIGKPCAASDAVIEEITFELENLSKFINCHCQELQTYFRMNPNGGRRLRNSVHKIDKLLNNFYKKAKEIKDCETKLKKKLCPIQTKPSPSSVGKQLLRDMDLLAYDMENAENYNISYNDAFGAVGREFIDSTRNCLILDDQERSNPLIRVKKHKTMKTYSLDNINVNIICDPQRSVGTEMDFGSVTNPTLKENSIGTNSLYDGRNIGVTGNSNHFPINTEKKGLRRFFFRRNKSQKKVKSRPFAYLVPTVYEEMQLPKKKRHVYENAIESPLITDGGGAFWHDYLAKTNTDKSRVARDMSPTKNSTYGNKTSRINGFQKFFSNNKYYNKDAERNLNKVLITVSPFNNDVEELQTSTDNAELETLTINGVLNLYNGPDWKYMDVENIYLNNLDADLINPPIGTVLADLESITTTTKAKKQETPLKAVTKSFTMTTLPVILEPSPKSHGTSKTTSRHTTNHQSSVKATEKHGNESFLSEKYSTNATLHLQRTDTTSSAQGSVNPYPYMRPGLNSSNNPHSKKTTTTATLKAKPVKKIKTNASKHDKKKTGYKTMTTTIIGTLLYHNDNMLNRTAGDETLSGTLAPVKHMYNTVKKSVQDSLCKIKNKPTTTKKNKKTTKKSTWCKTTKTKAKSQRKKTSTTEKKTKKKKKKKKKKKEHKKKKKKKDKDKNPGCKMFAFNKENDLSKKYKWAGSTDASYLDYNAKSGDDSMDQDTVFEDDYKSDEEESPESEKADKSEKENKSHKEKGSDKDDIYLSDDDLRLEMKYNTVEAANKLGDKYNKIDEQEENSEDKLKSEDNTKMKDKQKCEGHSNEDKGDSEDDDEEYENPVRFSTNSHSPTANIKSDDKEDGDDNDHFTNRSPISRDSQDNDNYMYEDYSRKPSGNYLKSLMFGIKSGTLNIFNRISKDFADGKNIQQQCAVCPVTTPINSLVGKNSKAVEINGKANANLYAQLTTSNPTILIINDYDHLNSDSEERVSVDGKMSTIANFKEDKKNTKSMFDNSNAFEVYERFKQKEKLKSSNEKYLNEYDSLERTTSSLSKQSKQNFPSSYGNENYNVFEVFKSLDMPDDVSSTTKKRGLFKKLSQKFSFKHGKDKKFKRKVVNNGMMVSTSKSVATSTTVNITEPLQSNTEEAFEPTLACDLHSTTEHITNLYHTLTQENFANQTKTISCFKYKLIPKMFTLDARKRRQCKNFEFYKNSREGKALMFDWIRRRKRSLDVGSDQNDDIDTHFVIKEDVFDIFDRKDNGIYKRREKSRKKRRTNSVEDLMRVLRNLPPIEPDINEIYVNLGDTVTIPCRERADNGTVHVWTTDRDDMLGYRNVDINDSSVIIKKVEIRNLGKYVCNDESKVLKTTILSTIEAPSFQVVFMLLYKSTARCNYDVLKAMKRLGSMMSSEVCGDGTHCSVRIDEPVCLKEKLGEQPLLVQAAGVLTAPHAPRPAPARTRRCVDAGLALLGAGVADVLLDAAVSISDEDSNHTLTPTTQDHRKWSITHTLRRKASRECGGTRASRGLSPRAVAVRAACPAGYRLDLRQVLCVSCPSDTFAPAQSVRCRACPSGARARPGAARCRPAPGDKWIQRNITVARSVLAGVCFALVTYLLCLCCRHRKGNFDEERKTEHHHRHRRNLSTLQVHRAPSRFLRRHSPSSSRNTDSHDEKFAVWKERNIPPPLPPIDFDLYEKS